MKTWSKITVILVILLCTISNKAYSQTPLDSLTTALNSNMEVEEKLGAILEASNSLIFSDPDTLVYYSNYAIKMCDKYELDDYKLQFLIILSEVHFALSNYSEALDYNFSAVKICERNKDTAEIASLYNAIGSIYRVSSKLEHAKEYFLKSIELRNQIKDSVGLAGVYNNIGIVYMMTSKYDTGMTYWGNSLDIKLAIGDSIGAATTMNNMAMYYRDIGETEKALEFFESVLRIKRKIKDHGSISLAYNNLGELFIKQGEYNKGLDYYLKALDEAETSKNKQLISHIHLTLAQTYYNHEDYKLAYDNFVTYSVMEDSIFSEKTVTNLDEIESKYQNEQKALIIENLEKEKTAQKEKQNLIIISAGVGLASMLIIILIVLKNYRQKKKDHTIISEQKNILFEKNKEITDSITYARRLQEAILPPSHLIEEHLPESFVLFKPKDVVSGDFYWLEHVNNKIYFAVADCTGHGVPGAMVSVVCSNALNRAVKEFNLTAPSKILDKVRELVVETFEKSTEDVKDGMDIALCTLDTSTCKLEYAGAHNPLWILRKGAEEIEEIKADKQPIGAFAHASPFTNHQVELKKGDRIYLFSDGYPDQFGGEKGKKLKYRPFKNLLKELSELSMTEQNEALLNKFNLWKGEIEQIDDVCVMSVII
jgi:serine phosphatase RsbU (regulator of sigma subunit)/tetratricopeptide (TPR) repeat protein